MMNSAKFLLPGLAAFLVFGLAAGWTAESEKTHAATGAAFAAPSQLTAALVQTNSIDLRWKNNATELAGNWVEFTTPGDEYVKLEAAWPDVTTFRHPDLAPETKFIYRIVPFFGKPSRAVGIMTGKAPPEGAPDTEAEGPLPPSNAKSEAPKKSVKDLATLPDAVPTGVTVTASSPTSVDIRWQDRATDEDGYLVEVSLDPKKDFQICALLPPDATSFKKVHLPPETKCYFRIRAFFYGPPSELASQTTPPEPPPVKTESKKTD